MEQNAPWPMGIRGHTITELRRAGKKLIDVDGAGPAPPISLADPGPRTCWRLTSVAPGGESVCEPVTRSAFELSAVRSIQKNGKRLTNSSTPIAAQAATRPHAMPFLVR